MTEEELDIYISLSTTFPYFLQELGMDRSHPLIFQLCDNSFQGNWPPITAHTEEERQIVRAWMVWELEYKRYRTMVWYTNHIANSINDILSFKLPEGHMGEPPERPYRSQLKYESDSVLWVQKPHDIIKGLTIANLIIEDINPNSETYKRITEALYPTLSFGHGSKFVTVW